MVNRSLDFNNSLSRIPIRSLDLRISKSMERIAIQENVLIRENKCNELTDSQPDRTDRTNRYNDYLMLLI